ncbi:MAG: hypothetical protein AAFV78_19350 [Bacteroidota bacterium]
MRSWQEFQQLHPVLLRIEQCYARLQKSTLCISKVGNPDGHIVSQWHDKRDWYENQMKLDIQKVNAHMYAWLAPFYMGDFVTLQQAMIQYGNIYIKPSPRESQIILDSFYGSLPVTEKARLGFWLDKPEQMVDLFNVAGEGYAFNSWLESYLSVYRAN